MTVKELKELIRDMPDDYQVVATGIEGPKAVAVSVSPNEDDREAVLYLEMRIGRYREVGIREIRH